MNRTVLIIAGLAVAGLFGFVFLRKRAAIAPPQKALPAPGEKPTSDEAQKAATALAEKMKKEAEEYKETLTSKIKSWA